MRRTEKQIPREIPNLPFNKWSTALNRQSQKETQTANKHFKQSSSLAIREDFLLPQSQRPSSGRQMTTNVGKDAGKGKPLFTTVDTDVVTMEIGMETSFKKQTKKLKNQKTKTKTIR